jgi:tetratricopeptide (TPR) repeat protein
LLTACASPKPSTVDPVIAQFASSASAAYERGALAQSAVFYEQALARARVLDDGVEIGRAAYNLAACRLALGSAKDTLSLLPEAQLELQRAGMTTEDVLVLQAKAQLALGRKDDARKTIDGILAAKSSPSARAGALVLSGGMSCDAGDRIGAEAELLKAREAARNVDDDSIKASLLQLSGSIAGMSHRWNDAARDHDAEAALLQRVGRYREMAEALSRAGVAYQKASLGQAATDRFYRSARSLFAQGDAVAALKTLDRGFAANKDAGDETLQAQLASLLDEIKRGLPAAE